jgi:D-aminoacyl-tRNA deacylase
METFFSRNPHFSQKVQNMILLVASNKDVASLNITRQILDHYPFKVTGTSFQKNPVYHAQINRKNVTLLILSEEAVNAQTLTDSFIKPDLIVFISRHSSTSGKPTLSVHTPGNIGTAELGGLPKQVSVSPATAMRDALKALSYFKEGMQLEYEVSYECTHHGPSLNAPTMFVELGSTPQQWRDAKAAEAVAHAAISAISKFATSENTAILGIGGTHYNQHFTHMAIEDEAVFGHMIAKYAIPLVDAEMLRQCIDKTLEKVDCAVLDWKGIKSQDKPQLLKALEEVGLHYRKA